MTKAELITALKDRGVSDVDESATNADLEAQLAELDSPGTPDLDGAIATPEENAALEHSDGGVTTRDPMDAGVPMSQGEASAPVGPEDAMGAAPTRGDYSQRIHVGPHAFTEVIPRDELRTDDDGRMLEDQPRTRLVEAGAAPRV